MGNNTNNFFFNWLEELKIRWLRIKEIRTPHGVISGRFENEAFAERLIQVPCKLLEILEFSVFNSSPKNKSGNC